MKFILSIIVCSSVYQSCLPPHSMPDLYNSHYECMIAGYNESIRKAKEIGPKEVNQYGTMQDTLRTHQIKGAGWRGKAFIDKSKLIQDKIDKFPDVWEQLNEIVTGTAVLPE